MKPLVIFDLDGTLLNTIPDLKNAVNHALMLQNLPQKSLEDVRRAIGNGVGFLVKKNLPHNVSNEQFKKALDDFQTYYHAHARVLTRPYKGMREMLTKLKEKGFLLAVCTNKSQDLARELITHFSPGLFDFIQGSVSFLKRKPDGEMIDYIVQKLQVKKSFITYVGDTEVDFQTAQNAGINCKLVLYGYRREDELKKTCPKGRFISDISALYQELINENEIILKREDGN